MREMNQRNSSFARVFVVLVGLVCSLVAFRGAVAGEIRILDAAGLVRAVKVVRGGARVVVTVKSLTAPDTPKALQGECNAVNVDGIATEKHTSISNKGECVFSDLTEGAWQIRVPEKLAWRVQIYE